MANTQGAVFTLALNGYGHDAMKLARSIYETELNIFWLMKHPEDIHDFLSYDVIQRKHIYDAMTEEQQRRANADTYAHMMDEYTEALKTFGTGKNKTGPPRMDWCKVSIYHRAKEAGLLDLYRTFYRFASSLHHGDIGGLIAQVDDDMDIEFAPSWGWIEDALTSGIGSFVRCLNYFDEIAQLGYKDRLQNDGGINDKYVRALKPVIAVFRPTVP